MSDADEAIFEAVQEALPNVTCRTFSGYCGMSEGYWGSLRAQGLELSIDALINLAENLEARKELLSYGVRIDLIDDAHALIVEEIATRQERLSHISKRLRNMIVNVMAQRAIKEDQQYSLPPIIFGWR